MNKYLTDTILQDGEARVMMIISELIVGKEYLQLKNGEIGGYIGKSTSAIAKLVHRLVKKGYLKSDNPSKIRKLYVLK